LRTWISSSLLAVAAPTQYRVLGVRGGDEDVRRLARNASLAWLPAGRAGHPLPDPSESETAEATTEASADSDAAPGAGKVVTQPVRSGQQVYAPEGDLIIMAPVGAGAEVLAAGHIHIYGPLRGGRPGRRPRRQQCQYFLPITGSRACVRGRTL